ncbi:DUF3299 domain-containing protein [Thalassotalea ponticola]|uniref:DUF3299 domain-containing protein n=1 Tax=Thalassotalea ponticola TaxID=1523392 RepID=UPI0025B44E59|nr:DUF3299 domain-containing protein [Thalassotalea ponticola]MDN3651631.1 DUF3299 domain-containing protein [Thalassotalea ponticola]
MTQFSHNTICSVFLTALLLIGVVAQVKAMPYQVITWDTLNAHVERKQLSNPFAEMEIDDIRKMQQIAIVRDIKSSGEQVDAQTQALADTAYKQLVQNGHDVEGLFKAREQIIAQRELEFSSTNPELDNARIQMRGFLLPLEFVGKKVSEFLLVPYVGACIHEPPPAANQIVYAKLTTPIEPPSLGLFTPIEVKGVMTSETLSPELSLVDGAKQIPTSYVLNVDDIEFIDLDD